MDPQFDATTDGGPAERSITANRLIGEVDRTALDRGRPAVSRRGNGPESTRVTIRGWTRQ
ncbi:hypothetical protein [Umezawaea sp.]|uniref:hypothetical protein n=1 Tax=Umezawaea sp. TaxID=1955258 RepID=UPI0039C98300